MKTPKSIQKSYDIVKLLRQIRTLKVKEDKLAKELKENYFKKQKLKFEIVALDPNISFTYLNNR